MNKAAKWIWINCNPEKDSYVVFKKMFQPKNSERLFLKIAAETNYIAYINGEIVGYGQFAGYPDEKYYDEIDISEYCKTGENCLQITVWYEGCNSFTHIDDGAGLIYAIEQAGHTLAISDKDTLCGKDGRYVSGREKFLTIQIGYTSAMIFNGQAQYSNAVEIEKNCVIKKRPVKRMVKGDFIEGQEILPNVYDLGVETAGYLSIKINSKKKSKVTVAYGEYLKDGKVAQILPGGYKNVGRDFSLDFYCAQGENSFTQYFVRVAGRYLQIFAEDGVEIQSVGLIPVYYPLKDKEIQIDGIDKQIYDTCIRTLKLCMHEHYEDCPWREQALYALDSRNQMLCGYHTFEGNEYQKANLIFMAKSKRKGGLMELTYPAVNTPAIPFFSLVYVFAVGEYIEHTNDRSILLSVGETVKDIIDTFAKRIDESGLIANFPAPFWNFYEWTEGSDNSDELIEGSPRIYKHDLILNCAYVYALEYYAKMSNEENSLIQERIVDLKKGIRANFFDKDKNLYYLSDHGKRYYSQVGNAFAVLIGLGEQDLIERLKSEELLIDATLSMKGFVYDALLKGNLENKQFILDEIRRNYGYMLSQGATSFWETLGGIEESESNSLCHGWSALPVYYYSKFQNNRRE